MMSSKTWFTSDTHFGHANIIRYCDRPFDSVSEMDDALVDAWNARVRPGDDVWHLGDFGWPHGADLAAIFERLNGHKRLIVGNHDGPDVLALAWAEPPVPMQSVRVDGQAIVLCHYAMRVWPRSHGGALHLYGHSHGSMSGDSQSCDVGVDCSWTQFGPVDLRAIRSQLARQPKRAHPDRHGREEPV